MAGDLAEEFRRVRVPLLGHRGARRWYWGQVLRSLVPLGASRAAELPTAEAKMGNLLQDLRHGARTLAQSPTFTLLTVATLGLAIGVNTAIFSMLNVVLLRPLPIRDPDTVAFVYTTNPDRGVERAGVSPGDFVDLRREIEAFEQLGAMDRSASFVLTGLEEPLRLPGFGVTANVFEIWRIPAFLGRTFREGEDRPGAEPVAMLAHHTWEERFGSDPDVVGRVVRIDGRPTTIVGVAPPEVEIGSLTAIEIWMPVPLEETGRRDVRNLWVTGRLREGVSVEQARQEVEAAGERLAAEHAEEAAGWQLTVFDMNRTLAPQQTWTILFLLGFTVALVMLIACSNVATMMLARAADRGREIAVRAALGASRRRILLQLLAESALLAVAAAALGLLLARLGILGLVWIAGDNSGITGFMSTVTIDGNVLLFTLLVAILAVLLFGLVPALRASRPDLVESLKEGSRGSTAGGLGVRRVLVAGQVALALALMVVAGITIQAMIDQQTLDPGFESGDLLTMRLDLPAARYPEPHQWREYFEDVRERLEALPAVRGVALMSHRYLTETPPTQNFVLETRPSPRPEETPWASVQAVSPGATGVIGLPVISGRGLEIGDAADARPVALVNADAARRFWPEQDPVGQRIRIAGEPEDRWREVVGVTADTRVGGPDNPTAPAIYLPYAQSPRPGMGVLVRTAGDPLASAGAVRATIWQVDREQPVGDMRTMEQLIDDDFRAGQTFFSMFVFFALFAVLMAGAGIYGVVAFAVTQRTQEIGIRMALGAGRSDVLGMVARYAAGLVGLGLVVGLAGGIGLGRVVTSALPGYDATDPLVLGTVALVVLVAAALAAWIPARRAAGIDPMLALRSE